MGRVRLAVAALLTVGLIGGGAALHGSDLFPIERVVVEGVSQLNEEDVVLAASITDDMTLIRLPRRQLEERLLALPWVSEVEVDRDWPDGIRITVRERVARAYIDTGEAALWVVDEEGFVVDSRIPEPDEALIVIRDVPSAEPRVGEPVAAPEFVNALAVVRGMSSELHSVVRVVSAPKIDRTTLITTDDVEILVGSADEFEQKDVVARRILSEHAGQVVHINVRTPDRPTWRGLSGESP